MLLKEAYEGDFARRCQAVLDRHSGVDSPDTLRLLHMSDPWSPYYCLLAHAGSLEPEALPTSLSRADVECLTRTQRSSDALDKPGLAGPRRGLPAREKILPAGAFVAKRLLLPQGDVDALLSVGFRTLVSKEEMSRYVRVIQADLAALFNEVQAPRCGARMQLCLDHDESQARDYLRAAVSRLGPRPTIDHVTGELTRAVERSFNRSIAPGLQIRVGIYVFTGSGWALCGTPESPLYLPGVVGSATRQGRRAFDPFLKDETEPACENAFEWVHAARTSVLLVHPLSSVWAEHLRLCHLQVPRSGGLCIAPISDYFDEALTIGLLLVSIDDCPILGPQHAFLVRRLAQSVTVYLSRLLPVHGFPWWPDARLSRGGARITKGAPDAGLERIVADLLPTGSSVEVQPLSSGLTDSRVFRLTVYDEKNVVEIPRVLKIGPAEAIGDELFRYYRYVNNKRVGGHARVDAARGYPGEPWKCRFCPEDLSHRHGGTAAILYTFAGAGADVQPWSVWAMHAEISDVENAIDDLMDQLDCWHGRRRIESRTLADVVLTDEILAKQKRRCESEPEPLQSLPTIEETVDVLGRLKSAAVLGVTGSTSVHTCLSHGDPHCDNLFAVFDRHGKLKDVAIIDWGKVSSGQHPLTDICILLADLVFRVRACSETDLSWMEVQIDRWARHFGCSIMEGHLIAAVHLLRMLAWRHSDSRAAWLVGDRRANAWEWLTEKLRNHGLLNPKTGEP